jgi:hypothetical protein
MRVTRNMDHSGAREDKGKVEKWLATVDGTRQLTEKGEGGILAQETRYVC